MIAGKHDDREGSSVVVLSFLIKTSFKMVRFRV